MFPFTERPRFAFQSPALWWKTLDEDRLDMMLPYFVLRISVPMRDGAKEKSLETALYTDPHILTQRGVVLQLTRVQKKKKAQVTFRKQQKCGLLFWLVSRTPQG